LTLPTSDSLSGTTSFIALRSLSTANAELDELDEAAPEDAFALVPPVAPLPPPASAADAPPPEDPSAELEALLVPPPEAVSPTSPDNETIVPLSGARRRVSAIDCSSRLTVSRSLLTAAFAEAMFASRVAALIVELALVLVGLPVPVAAVGLVACGLVACGLVACGLVDAVAVGERSPVLAP
jgi:hypothetical protein